MIYILTNRAFPNFIKIGCIDDIDKKLKQMNRNEILPFEFQLYAEFNVDSTLADKELTKLLSGLINSESTTEASEGRENCTGFFAITAEEGYSLLESIAKITGTTDRLKRIAPEECAVAVAKNADGEQKRTRRAPFSFSKAGIPVGAEIVFTENEDIRPVVVDDRHISYNGKTTFLSALAKELLGSDVSVSGTRFFSYDGKKLDEIRENV